MGVVRCSRKRLPNLSPADYFAFPKLKTKLKRNGYATISDSQTSVKTKLKTISITDLVNPSICDSIRAFCNILCSVLVL